MFSPKNTDVFVVGAGPVGMMTALELDRLGVHVGIIDKDDGPATHSYACILHARSMHLLKQLGLADQALERGLRVERIGIYENTARCADLVVSMLPGDAPYLLVLPQSDLEEMLEAELNRRGIQVEWLHRLSGIAFNVDGVSVSIDELSDTGKGYAVPHLDQIVRRRKTVNASFLIGADGRDSVVRQQLGIADRVAPGGTCYEISEFEESREPEDEVRVVFNNGATSIFTPLPGKRGRWTLAVDPEDLGPEAHLKDRHHFRVFSPVSDDGILARTRNLIKARASWFETEINGLEWHATVDFPNRMVRQFGQDRCWLLGEAAHLNSPIGVQTMNVGFVQGVELAGILASILQGKGAVELLDTFNGAARSEWEHLLGLKEALEVTRRAEPWAQRNSGAFPGSIPASGEDLEALLRQIGIEYNSSRSERLTPA
jgi:2-polyprenyl-6-methoxyphenol hydroxylase-like FAD-dependent oxidoreductase